MNCWAGTAPSPNRADSVSRWAAEKFVTIQNGIPNSREPSERIGRPGQQLALEDDHAVGVENEPADARECLREIGHRIMLGGPAPTGRC